MWDKFPLFLIYLARFQNFFFLSFFLVPFSSCPSFNCDLSPHSFSSHFLLFLLFLTLNVLIVHRGVYICGWLRTHTRIRMKFQNAIFFLFLPFSNSIPISLTRLSLYRTFSLYRSCLSLSYTTLSSSTPTASIYLSISCSSFNIFLLEYRSQIVSHNLHAESNLDQV